jgi:hypothetical protein
MSLAVCIVVAVLAALGVRRWPEHRTGLLISAMVIIVLVVVYSIFIQAACCY